MCRKLLMICILGVVFTLGAGMAGAQQINALIWDNDNESHYIDPDNGATRQSEYSLISTLGANGVNYTVVTTLPNNLDQYDIVCVELGIYCVG